jgi:hypothetical protein
MKTGLVMLLLLAVYIWTWGTLNAKMEYDSSNWHCEEYRSELGISALFAFLPPIWIASPFITGFYKFGWRLMPRPECLEMSGGKK